MKAIILAAGKGTRLRPLTLETPKAMVKVFWKTLLEYNMERLLPYVDEYIIVVKYKKEAIINHFWSEYQWIPVSYHEQGEEKGTGAAVKWIKTQGDLIIAYADAIISQDDVDKVMQCSDYAVLVKEVEKPEKYGIFKSDTEGYAMKVVEKPTEHIGNLANFSFFKVNDSILDYVEQTPLSPRGELEITDAINIFCQEEKLKLVHLQHDIIDITSLEDLERANTLTKPSLWDTQYLENIWDYELHLWIPETGIQEIVKYSLDPTDTALREWTSDWKKRFISEENLCSWYNDTDRYPFTLLDTNGTVVGLWWGRPAKAPSINEVLDKKLVQAIKENQDYIHTSGIRIYPLARWKRLARPFLEVCTKYYDHIFQNIHMCIDIDEKNIPSQKSFEKGGFEKVWYGKNINNSPESETKRFVYLKISL